MSLQFADFLDKGARNIVTIDGHGGSGKSTLAGYLADRHRATVIKLDDFTGWQPKDTWREDFIATVLEPLANRVSSLTYKPVSWWPDHKPNRVSHTFIGNLVIIDGVRSCSDVFRTFITSSIFVESDTNLCLMRGIERDIANGYDKGDVMKIWKQNMETETEYFTREDVAGYASIILDGSKPYEGQIE